MTTILESKDAIMFTHFRVPGKPMFWGKCLPCAKSINHWFMDSYICQIKCCLIQVHKWKGISRGRVWASLFWKSSMNYFSCKNRVDDYYSRQPHLCPGLNYHQSSLPKLLPRPIVTTLDSAVGPTLYNNQSNL